MNFAALITRLFLCRGLLFYKNFFLRVVLKKITKLSGTIVIYLSIYLSIYLKFLDTKEIRFFYLFILLISFQQKKTFTQNNPM